LANNSGPMNLESTTLRAREIQRRQQFVRAGDVRRGGHDVVHRAALREQADHVVLPRDVGRDRAHVAHVGQGLPRRRKPFGRTARDDDRCAVGEKHPGEAQPHAGTAAGDQYVLFLLLNRFAHGLSLYDRSTACLQGVDCR
jgi:hypothetical protein